MSKEDRIYDEYNIELSLLENSRELFRKKLIALFLEEKNGYWREGIKHVTKYKYFVEKIKDDRRVFLSRPARLNKGMDFEVWVEKFRDEKNKRPSHKDIFNDILEKYKTNPDIYPKLLEAIELVWNCEEPDKVIEKYNNLEFGVGLSVELILKILKWLFIEQDITYWNYDGRTMLWQGIKNIVNTQDNTN